jgi:hypothetical protein
MAWKACRQAWRKSVSLGTLAGLDQGQEPARSGGEPHHGGVTTVAASNRARSGVKARRLLTLLAFTPLNLVFDCFSQHMRATLKSLQHVIDASECSDLKPHQEAF